MRLRRGLGDLSVRILRFGLLGLKRYFGVLLEGGGEGLFNSESVF
jgi:hypothetical protein